MRRKYPSDISKAQFKKVRPILEGARKKTRPRVIDIYDVFCGVLYLLKSGCQWRMLPSDFPKWPSIYAYFRIWSNKKKNEDSLLEQALKKVGWRGSYQQWSKYENKLLHN